MNIKPMKGNVADINNLPNIGWIAEEKIDGFRVIMEVGRTGNRLYSRTMKEITQNLPHLAKLNLSGWTGSILDGELVSATGRFLDLAGIAGPNTKPERAIKFQEENGYAIFNVFDILSFCGDDVQPQTLAVRKFLLGNIFGHFNSQYMIPVKYYHGEDVDFRKLLEEMWQQGKEGLMLKNWNAPYEQKKSRHILKLKEVHTYDVVVTGFQAPTKEYEGQYAEGWPYWETCDGKLHLSYESFRASEYKGIPVTKPYAMGWIGAVEFSVYRDGELFKVGECRGFNEEDLASIACHRDNMFGRVMEVKAQGIIDMDKGTLRHPQFSRWRDDKPASECTFDAHINS